MEVIWDSKAKASLRNTILQIRKKFGSRVAEHINSEFKQRTRLLSVMPQIGSIDSALSDTECIYRFLVVKQSKIYYRIDNDIVRILLIWDTRQDPETLKELM